MPKVVILVQNDIYKDPRVSKEFGSATFAGFDTEAYCCYLKDNYSGKLDKACRVHFVPYPLQRLRERSKHRITAQSSETTRKFGVATTVMVTADAAIRYIWSNVHLYLKIRKSKADIIHAADLDTLLAGWLYKKLHGAKLLYDSHELWVDMMQEYNPPWLSRLLTKYERFLIRRCDGVITVNDAIATELMSRYNIMRPYVVMNCPLKTEHEFRETHPEVRVIYQGVFNKNRAIDSIISAFNHLPEGYHLYLRGPSNQYIEEIRQKNIGNHRVTFCPPVPMDELVSGLSDFDIGIVSYIPDNTNSMFASPNKLFEYMMAGIPVVSSDLLVVRGILKDHNCGEVFDNNDPQSIADAIVRVTNNYGAMSKNVLSAAMTEFNWERQEKVYILVLKWLEQQIVKE